MAPDVLVRHRDDLRFRDDAALAAAARDGTAHPVVDFEARRAEAREAWAALGDRAGEALSDPEIRRRASLSRRRNRDAADTTDGARPTTAERTHLGAFEN